MLIDSDDPRVTFDALTTTFVAEASSLGLRPGEVPMAIDVRRFGVVIPFGHFGYRRSADGDVVAFLYRQPAGPSLAIQYRGSPYLLAILND